MKLKVFGNRDSIAVSIANLSCNADALIMAANANTDINQYLPMRSQFTIDAVQLIANIKLKASGEIQNIKSPVQDGEYSQIKAIISRLIAGEAAYIKAVKATNPLLLKIDTSRVSKPAKNDKKSLIALLNNAIGKIFIDVVSFDIIYASSVEYRKKYNLHATLIGVLVIALIIVAGYLIAKYIIGKRKLLATSDIIYTDVDEIEGEIDEIELVEFDDQGDIRPMLIP